MIRLHKTKSCIDELIDRQQKAAEITIRAVAEQMERRPKPRRVIANFHYSPDTTTER